MVPNNFFLIILLSWFSLKPFLKKWTLLNLDTEYFLIHSVLKALFAIITYKFIDKNNFKDIINIDKNQITNIIIISTISIIGGFYSYIYLKNYDVGYFKIMKKSGTLVFTVFFGCLFFGENFNNDKKTGLFFILLGIYLINIK